MRADHDLPMGAVLQPTEGSDPSRAADLAARSPARVARTLGTTIVYPPRVTIEALLPHLQPGVRAVVLGDHVLPLRDRIVLHKVEGLVHKPHVVLAQCARTPLAAELEAHEDIIVHPRQVEVRVGRRAVVSPVKA